MDASHHVVFKRKLRKLACMQRFIFSREKKLYFELIKVYVHESNMVAAYNPNNQVEYFNQSHHETDKPNPKILKLIR